MRSHISQVVTLEMWEARKSMFGNRCVYCGVPESADTPMTMDHVKPISKGGAHILSNLRPACRACNGRKHNKWSEEWVRKGLAALV